MAEYYNESRDSLKDHQSLPVGKLAKRTVLVDNEVTRVSYFELEPLKLAQSRKIVQAVHLLCPQIVQLQSSDVATRITSNQQ